MRSRFLLAVIIFTAIFLFCSHNSDILNLSHLNHLYDEVKLQDKFYGLIYIYSEYPDYKPVEAKGEGITCLDDIARGAIVFLKHFEQTGDKTSLEKGEKLLNTILYLQSRMDCFIISFIEIWKLIKLTKTVFPD